jgi:hypothetical protein
MMPFPGMSVRETAQAIGTAKITHSAVTPAPSRREFSIAVM